MTFMSSEELLEMGFSSLGEDVKISRKASIYNCGQIRIGNHVRIDDFCVISAGSGGIEIGNNVHIAVFSSLIGTGKIVLSDFGNLSSRVSIYSSSDDYSGLSLTNPTVPEEFKSVDQRDVYLGKHVIVGSGSVILPGAILEEGVAVGALSLVNQACIAFGIYAGNPLKRVKERSKELLVKENQFNVK